MLRKALPPADVLRQLLDYDPETGTLTWRERSVEWFADAKNPANICGVWNARYAGSAAGMVCSKGYIRMKLCGDIRMAHRIIWKWLHDEEPEEIDHINRDKSDNRQANLRSVSHGVNMRNKPAYSTNSSGHKCIHWMPNIQRWTVQLIVPGKGQRQVAWLDTLDEAVTARDELMVKYGYDLATDAA